MHYTSGYINSNVLDLFDVMVPSFNVMDLQCKQPRMDRKLFELRRAIWGSIVNGALSRVVPKRPVLSLFVLFCPDLSPFKAPKRTEEDKRGQNGTSRDNLGSAPFRIHPHLALLN